MKTDEKSTVTLTGKNFQREVLESSRPVLVDFWAGWCGPCIAMAPAIEELAEEFGVRAVVGKLEVDDNSELAAGFGIQSIPTLLFFKDGEVVDRAIGLVSKEHLADKLAALVAA